MGQRVLQLRQLGDILLTTPIFRELKFSDPDVHLTFLSHEMGRLVIDGCPYVDEYFTYGNDWTLSQHLQLAKTLREREFDIVIDSMNNPRSAFYAFASGAKERVAFKSSRSFIYTTTIPRPTESDYIVKERLRLAVAAGFKVREGESHKLILPWFEKHTSPVMKLMGSQPAFATSPMRVVLSPTHRRSPRRWALKSYAALADRLTREWGAYVMWIWGPGEETEIIEAMSCCETTTYKSPATTFRELAALIANFDLFIGNSNGPSHVAVAVDTPSLQIHGPTSAKAWCPMTLAHQALQGVGADGRTKGDSIGIIDTISLEAVLEKLSEMKPVIESVASDRRKKWPRLNWNL